MIRKLLAVLDGGKRSESILTHVEPLMRTLRAEMRLAVVIPERKQSWKRYALSYLEALAKRLRARGGRVDVAVLTGTPAIAIEEFAKGEAFDLLALCSQGASPLGRFLPGRVADSILRRASLPVLIANPPTQEEAIGPGYRRIVVPLDGSHRSASILPVVSEIALGHNAAVTLVNVVSPARRGDLPVGTVANNLMRQQKDLQGRGLEVDLAILYGDPVTEILALSSKRQTDLIAVSTHGRTGLGRMLYGSVTQAILRENRAPMLILRTSATVRKHPVSPRGAQARHRAMDAFAGTGTLGKGPYN